MATLVGCRITESICSAVRAPADEAAMCVAAPRGCTFSCVEVATDELAVCRFLVVVRRLGCLQERTTDNPACAKGMGPFIIVKIP